MAYHLRTNRLVDFYVSIQKFTIGQRKGYPVNIILTVYNDFYKPIHRLPSRR